MTATLLVIGLLIVLGTTAAMGMRNPVHCVLALTISFAGIAALYLYLGAEFVGLTQIMVYVGAVAILTIFCIMMTRHPGEPEHRTFSRNPLPGLITAVAVFTVIGWAVVKQPALSGSTPSLRTSISVQQIGDALMHQYVLPLEIVGLLLTAALIGAIVIAMIRPEHAG